MRMLLIIITVVLFVSSALGLAWFRKATAAEVQHASEKVPVSFYDLQTRTLEAEPVDLGIYRGRVALVVNTASNCGLTPQYAGLEKLYRELASRGLVILGFPSNDFLNQEPGSPAEIREFCDMNYQVTFPLFEKVQVKGDDKGAVYRYLTAELEEPTWNFTKYLIDRQGRSVARFGPRTAPDSEELLAAIEAELTRE
jgi:glutathione peroxidase